MWLVRSLQKHHESATGVLSYSKVCSLAHLALQHHQHRPSKMYQLAARDRMTNRNDDFLCWNYQVTHGPKHSLLVWAQNYQKKLLPKSLPFLNTSGVKLVPTKERSFAEGFRCLFHTSAWNKDIPDYLKGNVSKIDNIEEDLLYDDLEEEDGNCMEEDIADFLTCHIVPYEEAATSFTVQCPTCSKENVTRPQEIFVDKNSGYFVCPWCSRSGSWEELMQLLNAREDCITPEQLQAFLDTTVPIAEAESLTLQDSPLKGVSSKTLKKFNARLTNDGTRVVVPVQGNGGEIIGIESISTLHQHPLVVRRYLVGKASVFGAAASKRTHQRVILVPSCCDVLTLAEHNIPAVSLPTGNVEAVRDYIANSNKLHIVLWLGSDAPPRQLLVALIQSGVSCSLIRTPKNDLPIHLKSLKEIREALKDTIPVLSEATTTFEQLKDKIYHRLTHKEETCGVQWKRYTDLNELLLGHRPGELTVLTGPTGSGKTTFMAEYSMDLCAQGVKTLWGSFEISVVRLCEIMLQQYSGTHLPQDPVAFNNLASQFASLPFHFLTYHGQQTVSSVIKAMTEAVQVWGVQHVIIDNLQFMLGTGEQSMDRWWEQDRAVAAFRRFATTNNCHITLIVHPKKVPDGQLLSINSVFGGAKVTQEADNVLILQVKDTAAVAQSKKALQVMKNRYGGQLGVVPLRFHKESLTMSSCFRRKEKEKDKGVTKSHESKGKQDSHQQSRVKGLSAFGF